MGHIWKTRSFVKIQMREIFRRNRLQLKSGATGLHQQPAARVIFEIMCSYGSSRTTSKASGQKRWSYPEILFCSNLRSETDFQVRG